jgi:phosphate transport system protein
LDALESASASRMAGAMVHDSLDALVRQNAELAQRVLLSDDAADRLRDAQLGRLIGSMEKDASVVSSAIHLLFVVRYLERIAGHATNIGEDVLFYLRGVDVRHRFLGREC